MHTEGVNELEARFHAVFLFQAILVHQAISGQSRHKNEIQVIILIILKVERSFFKVDLALVKQMVFDLQNGVKELLLDERGDVLVDCADRCCLFAIRQSTPAG